MFGKPEWFKKKKWGWGLTPITWQGWVYTLVWSGVICGPFTLLVSRAQIVEALIWMGATISFLCFDVFATMKKMKAQNDLQNLYFIDDETPDSPVSTETFDLHLKN